MSSKSVISCSVGMMSHSGVNLPQHELTALTQVLHLIALRSVLF